jgi:SAM-dependent methyltransferase
MNLDYAPHHDASFEKNHWWPRARFGLIDRVLARFPPDRPLDILEVGCGTGINLDYLEEKHARRLSRLVGVDPEQSFSRKGLRATRQDLPEGESFDIILLMDVLEHLKEPADLLMKLRGFLKSSGVLLVTVPAFSWLWTTYDEVTHHHRRYSLPQLKTELKGAGYHVTEDYYLYGLLFPMFLLQRLSLRIYPRQDPHLFKPSAPWVNGLLTAVMRLEMRTLIPFNHLAGSSAVAIARVS